MRLRVRFGIHCLVFMAFFQFANAQGVQLHCPSGSVYCAGYGSFNQALVQIAAFPAAFPIANTAVVYNWYARHAKGVKVWHTTSSRRMIPLPWSGTYTIWVEVHYIDLSGGQRRRYAVYYADPLTITAHVCGEEKGGSVEKY